MDKITRGSEKRCREFFNYKGIGKMINLTHKLLQQDYYSYVGRFISEFIYDYSDPRVRNVMLFLIRENYPEFRDELNKFEYINV